MGRGDIYHCIKDQIDFFWFHQVLVVQLTLGLYTIQADKLFFYKLIKETIN